MYVLLLLYENWYFEELEYAMNVEMIFMYFETLLMKGIEFYRCILGLEMRAIGEKFLRRWK